MAAGETATGIAGRLVDEGLLRDRRAFLLIAIDRQVTGQLDVGTFLLRRNQTPDQLVATLLEAKDPSFLIQFRAGLRLEQMTAYIQARPDEIATLQMDAADFLALVRTPPQKLLADYPWLDLPKGATLRGLPRGGRLPRPARHDGRRSSSARCSTGSTRTSAPTGSQAAKAAGPLLPRGVDPRLARGARDGRRRRAGADRRRLRQPDDRAQRDGRLPGLGSDHLLRQRHAPAGEARRSPAGPSTRSGRPSTGACRTDVPAELAAYNTYKAKGLPAGPDLHADGGLDRRGPRPRHQGRLPLLLSPRRRGPTVFAKTYEEHQQNIKKDGGRLSRARGPVPADFAGPPTARRLRAWEEADGPPAPRGWAASARAWPPPGIDAYFGLRREEIRYLAGVVLGRGRGEGRRPLGPLPRDRRRGRRPGRLALHAPGAPRGARRPRGGRHLRPRGPLAVPPGLDRRAARGRPGGRPGARPLGGPPRSRRRTSSWSRPDPGSTRTAPSRSPPRSNGSPRRPRWPTARSRRCSPRSAPA